MDGYQEKGRVSLETKTQEIEDRGSRIKYRRGQEMMIMYIEAYLRRVEKTWARSKKSMYMYR